MLFSSMGLAVAQSRRIRPPLPNREMSRFATLCKSGGDQAELRRHWSPPPPRSGPPTPLAARRTRARDQDDRRGGPARLSSNGAARTRIRRGCLTTAPRFAVCYGLRAFANGPPSAPAVIVAHESLRRRGRSGYHSRLLPASRSAASKWANVSVSYGTQSPRSYRQPIFPSGKTVRHE